MMSFNFTDRHDAALADLLETTEYAETPGPGSTDPDDSLAATAERLAGVSPWDPGFEDAVNEAITAVKANLTGEARDDAVNSLQALLLVNWGLAPEPEPALTAAASDHWKQQIRIPKGNGDKSGQWTFTPWMHLDDVLDTLSKVQSSSVHAGNMDEFNKRVRAKIEVAKNVLAASSMSDDPNDPVVLTASEVAGQLFLDAAVASKEMGIPHTTFEIAAKETLAFAEYDWSLYGEDTDIGAEKEFVPTDPSNEVKKAKDLKPGDIVITYDESGEPYAVLLEDVQHVTDTVTDEPEVEVTDNDGASWNYAPDDDVEVFVDPDEAANAAALEEDLGPSKPANAIKPGDKIIVDVEGELHEVQVEAVNVEEAGGLVQIVDTDGGANFYSWDEPIYTSAEEDFGDLPETKEATKPAKDLLPGDVILLHGLPITVETATVYEDPWGGPPYVNVTSVGQQSYAFEPEDEVTVLSPVPGLPSAKGWEKVGSAKGSNPGGTYKAEDGTLYYVKQSKSALHARNEALAAALYALTGVKTTDPHLVTYGNDDQHLGTAAKIIDGVQGDMTGVQQGFATDAWLANWDVVGLSYDNVWGTPEGPVRVDLGGSLLFRAQGTPKGSDFGAEVKEWDTFGDASINPQSASVFGKMTDAQKKESATVLLGVTDGDIDATVDKVFGDEDPESAGKLKATLKARRDDILKKAGLTKPEADPAEQAEQTAKAPQVTPGDKVQVGMPIKGSDIEVGDVLHLDGAVLKKAGGELVPSTGVKPTVAEVKIGKKWANIVTTSGQKLWVDLTADLTVEREVEPTTFDIPSTKAQPGDILKLTGPVLKKSAGKLIPAEAGKQGKHDDEPVIASIKHGKKWSEVVTTTGQKLWIDTSDTITVERTPGLSTPGATPPGTPVDAPVNAGTGYWKGKPAPVLAPEPEEPKPGKPKKGSFDEWLVKVKARYEANPNKAKATLEESNNWSTVQNVLSGDPDLAKPAITKLFNSQYLDDALKAEAEKIYSDAAQPKPGEYAAYAKEKTAWLEAKKHHDELMKAWRADNPTSLKGMNGGKVFSSNTEAWEWANKNLAPIKAGSKAALKSHQSSSTGKNMKLWNKGGAVPDDMKDYVKKMDATMSPIPEDIYLFRGTNLKEFNGSEPPDTFESLKKSVGSVFTNWGYAPTSVGVESGYSNHSQVNIVYRAPAGTKGVWASPNHPSFQGPHGEREFTLARGTSIFIHKVTEKNGLLYVEAEILPEGQASPTGQPAAPLTQKVGTNFARLRQSA
jgi:hypothetical protein